MRRMSDSLRIEVAIEPRHFNVEMFTLSLFIFKHNSITADPNMINTVDKAINIVEQMRFPGITDNIADPNPDLAYFCNNILPMIEDEEDKAMLLQQLNQLKEHIINELDYITNKKKREEEEQNKKAAQSLKEIKEALSQIEKIPLSGDPDDIDNPSYAKLRSDTKTLRHTYFPYYSHEKLLYDIIRCEKVADVYYLHSTQEFSLKADWIASCIENNDYSLAKALVDRLIQTSTYPNFINYYDEEGHYRGYCWEAELINTISCLIRKYARDKRKAIEIKPAVIFIRKEIERIAPLLSEEKQMIMRSEALSLAITKKEQQTYLEDLLSDVKEYAKPRRRKPYNSTYYVNHTTSRIMESFTLLEKYKRIDGIVNTLSIIEQAGPNLRPLNLDGWMDHCIRVVNGQTCYVLFTKHRELIDKWIQIYPSKSAYSTFKEKIIGYRPSMKKELENLEHQIITGE